MALLLVFGPTFTRLIALGTLTDQWLVTPQPDPLPVVMLMSMIRIAEYGGTSVVLLRVLRDEQPARGWFKRMLLAWAGIATGIVVFTPVLLLVLRCAPHVWITATPAPLPVRMRSASASAPCCRGTAARSLLIARWARAPRFGCGCRLWHRALLKD